MLCGCVAYAIQFSTIILSFFYSPPHLFFGVCSAMLYDWLLVLFWYVRNGDSRIDFMIGKASGLEAVASDSEEHEKDNSRR